jgi:hypothetical protein
VHASNIASEIIFNLDLAQEDKQLTQEERELRSTLKAKLLGFAAIDRSKWRQRSRLTWIKEGSANTKLFHLRANGRRRKNHIPELVGERGRVSTHMEKEEILYNFVKGSLGEAHGRTIRLNWGTLNMLRGELQNLDELFTEEELKAAVFRMPGEKAPGPDGFTACFFKTCWTIIKDNLLAAFNCFHSLHTHIWKLLNTADMVLLPKKERSETASDYRPVSLMHSILKILCKLLANRLAPELDKLISRNQSAFIKKRSIQDNFLYVKNVIRDAHCKNSPTAFLKLDLAKAFDSVEWPFLLEVLEQMGFGQRWRDMISILLASSSSRVLLNGKQGRLFRHR